MTETMAKAHNRVTIIKMT